MQNGAPRDDLREAIVQLGLEYRLMTQFTSFVAVEEMTVTTGGEPRRIEVPVEMPEGVSYEGVFGESDALVASRLAPASVAAGRIRGAGGGTGAGVGSGIGGGVFRSAKAPPPPQAQAKMSEMIVARDVELQLSPAERKQRQLRAKLHSSIAAVIERLKTPNAPPPQAKFIKDGKAEIQIFLSDVSPAVLAQLRQLGFEPILQPKSGKTLLGRIAVGKLSALAELEVVVYIKPLGG
jgi:Ca-activated chloride channel family protein